MKFYLKTALLLLALLIVILAAVGCQQIPDTDEDTTPSETTADIPAPAEDLEIVKDGKACGRVIRSGEPLEYSAVLNAVNDIYLAVKDKTGVLVTVETDWVKKGEQLDHEKPEILVGITDYSESAEVYKDINYGEWEIRAVGNKLVVAAHYESALKYAANQLKKYINENASEGNLVIPADISLGGEYNAMLASLPVYEGGKFVSTCEATGRAIMVYLTETNAEEYENYISKLSAAGYTQYIRNYIGDNLFATLNSDKYTVNVIYYAYENAVRIVVEPLAPAAGYESENVYTEVTTPQITMLGTAYPDNNGLSMLIRLSDGRFIVVDGAHNKTETMDSLIDRMKEQSAEYRKEGEKIVIAAWLVTHTHADHTGALRGKYSRMQKDFKVERMLCNFIDDEEQAKGVLKYGADGVDEGNNEPQVEDAARALGAEIMYVHTGQTFYFADLKVEILYTIEDHLPNLINAFNTTSVVYKLTFGGETTVLVTGDATNHGMGIANRMFGNYLKCDILQVNHHGWTPWAVGSTADIKDAFVTVAPTALLWPAGQSEYASTKGREYNVVLYHPDDNAGGKNPNLQELYIAGDIGEYVTVPMPYKVGNVYVSNPDNKIK